MPPYCSSIHLKTTPLILDPQCLIDGKPHSVPLSVRMPPLSVPWPDPLKWEQWSGPALQVVEQFQVQFLCYFQSLLLVYLWITICFITVPNYCLLQLINEIYITVLINSKVLPAIWDIGLISTLYPVFKCIIINTHLTVQHCPSLFISLSLYHIFILVYRRAWSYLHFAIGLCIPSSNKNIVMSSCLVACLHNLAITIMHELCMSCGRSQTRPQPLSTSGLCLSWDWGKVKFGLYML